MIKEWELYEDVILIDGDGHTWIAFDYRETKEDPKIIFIESDEGCTFTISESFSDFLDGLLPHDDVFDEDGDRINL